MPNQALQPTPWRFALGEIPISNGASLSIAEDSPTNWRDPNNASLTSSRAITEHLATINGARRHSPSAEASARWAAQTSRMRT